MRRSPQRVRDESGQVLVFTALTLTALLLVAALVLDTGHWFTHKRQLQNRADAAALAAGVEYAGKWSACIQDTDAALKTQTAAAIVNAARKFAGDPTVSDGVNKEVADQAKVNVVINSTSYNPGTDYSDGTSGDVASPCYNHPADAISPAGGYWTDVRVKERDVSSLFGKLGINLAQTGARARVEIRPALSLNGLLPLAVPDQRIVKAQIRYYDECVANDSNPATGLLGTIDLNPLTDAYQTETGNGVTFWGARPAGAAPGDRVAPTAVTLPSYPTAGCSPGGGSTDNPWTPIGVEVRVAAVPTIDLNSTRCSVLAAAKFADCFHQLSTIRAWPTHATSDASNVNIAPPLIKDVTLTSPPCPTGDEYFGRAADGTTTCTPGTVGVSVDVDWGDRDDGPLNVRNDFDVYINGLRVTPRAANPTGVWVRQTALAVGAGGTDITVRLTWNHTGASDTWRGKACKNPSNPCTYDETFTVHRTYAGQGADDAAAGYVALTTLVRTSLTTQASGSPPGTSLGSYSIALTPSPALVPTIGLKSALVTGTQTTLRDGDPQGNQTVDCDGLSGKGTSQIREMLARGCFPFYGANKFVDGIWWNDTTKTCPSSGLWYSLSLPTSSQYYNTATNPWRCVPTLPGSRGSLIDGIQIRTGNCPGYNTSSFVCSPAPASCINPNYYDPALKASRYPGPGKDPRIVPLFVLPYQALKGSTGGSTSEVVPILGFASFYITGWKATGSNADKCTTDPDGSGPARPDIIPTDNGAITGYFIADFTPEPGPSDPNAVCTLDQLVPCRASLVR